MSEQVPVTGNELTQALSKSLVDIVMGRNVKKSRLQNQIDVSDALVRRYQVQINAIKAMNEAKKNGIDFAAAINEVRAQMNSVGEDISMISTSIDE